MPVDKSYIGRMGEPVTMHVERGKIREFARAIKDDDPLYFDEAHATREAGGIMPPVTFLQTASHWDDGRGRARLPFDLQASPARRAGIRVSGAHPRGRRAHSGEHGGGRLREARQARGQHELRGHGDGVPQPAGDVVARARATTIETGQVVKD